MTDQSQPPEQDPFQHPAQPQQPQPQPQQPGYGPPAGGFGQPAAVYGGAPFGQPAFAAAGPPENYLVWAILATVLCCLPFGIVAIVYAAQVNSKFYVGDYAGAVAASQSARKWAIASAATSLGLLAVYAVGLLALVATGR